MKIRFIAVLLAAIVATAGVMAFNGRSPSSATGEGSTVAVRPAAAVQPEANSTAFLDDFKAGYADGFGSGVASYSYPDQSSMASNSQGYLDGFSQGYGDGQQQRASLRSELCPNAQVSVMTEAVPSYSQPRYAAARRISAASPAAPALSRSYSSHVSQSRPVDRGINTTLRKAMLIGGGAAAGAGIGGAIGGGKGALIGALVGGGTGTALAMSKQPNRAFNRRVSGKDIVVNSLLGAGAGAGIGALAGGKRGALAGAGIGGGGGALWSVINGKRVRQ